MLQIKKEKLISKYLKKTLKFFFPDDFKTQEKDKAAEERINKRKKYNQKAKLERTEAKIRKMVGKKLNIPSKDLLVFKTS